MILVYRLGIKNFLSSKTVRDCEFCVSSSYFKIPRILYMIPNRTIVRHIKTEKKIRFVSPIHILRNPHKITKRSPLVRKKTFASLVGITYLLYHLSMKDNSFQESLQAQIKTKLYKQNTQHTYLLAIQFRV